MIAEKFRNDENILLHSQSSQSTGSRRMRRFLKKKYVNDIIRHKRIFIRQMSSQK